MTTARLFAKFRQIFHNRAVVSGMTKRAFFMVWCALWATSCGTQTAGSRQVAQGSPQPPVEGQTPSPTPNPTTEIDSRPPLMHQPVPLYEGGVVTRQIDAATARAEGFVVVDLGEVWTPYIFSERANEAEAAVPNTYRTTYLALARGEFPNDHHGARARDDKYLELYGITPTLGLLRTRMQHTSGLACAATLDLAPLRDFDGMIIYDRESNATFARGFRVLERWATDLAQRRGVAVGSLTVDGLPERDARRLADYLRQAPRAHALLAAQRRLQCEGFFEDKGRVTEGAFDWPTHEALAEFERRHRVYGWGYLGRETLEMLRRSPMDVEQEDVIRIVTERAMHAAGVIEDGSVDATFVGRDGQEHQVPNLEGQIRTSIIEAFGLVTPERTLAFLTSLGTLAPTESKLVAIRGPSYPEYYNADMDLSVETDRGDVWYEFPYDENGVERGQSIERRPRITIYTHYLDRRINLARYGTTIGGWRSEMVNGIQMWKYKNSPPGPVVWHQVVAAPVWLPPDGTPPRDLLHRTRDGYAPNYHETGPSYASAYGLVAAYHIRYRENEDGTLTLRGDEGIRTHGSVDYMSIMRRFSHGCHRMHNHMAVRLMSFVLAHRHHTRDGQQHIAFSRDLVLDDGRSIRMDITQGGYVFQLERPIRVNVLEGRIRGSRNTPIETPLPRYNTELGAYVTPEGQWVSVNRMGEVVPLDATQIAERQARQAALRSDAGVADAH